jgi:hypothetical protein
MGAASQPPAGAATPPTPSEVALNWARRLKRVFGIELKSCTRYDGKLEGIASIEEPQVVVKILAHLKRAAPRQNPTEPPLRARAPPVQPALL